MAGKSPDKAGTEAAQRSEEEQAQVLADAKPPTDKQAETLAEASGGVTGAPDDTAGTDVDPTVQVGPAPAEARVPELSDDKDAPEAPQPSGVDQDALGTNTVRHSDQVLGKDSASAFAVRQAFKLSEGTTWDESVHKAIVAFQEELGQHANGYLTRDQCRRLGLTYLGR